MLNIPAPELARTLDRTGRWRKKWEVRRRNDEDWVDLSAYVVGDSVPIGTPDAPAMDFTVRFAREPGATSLAPGISESDFNRDTEDFFRPLLPPRAYIRGFAANLVKTDPDEAAVWRPIAEGEIEITEWPGAEVVCQCKTWDAVVERAWIEDKEERGGETEEEAPLMEDEIQGLIDRWQPSLPFALALVTPVSPEHSVGLYSPEGSLGAQIRTMVQTDLGWDVRFLPNADTGAPEYTLYEPPRDNVTPDLELEAYMVEQVPGLKEDPTHLRNAFKLTGQADDGRQFTVVRVNELSINGGDGYGDGYGRNFMAIEDPKVKTEAHGDALLAFADNDLSKPLAELRIRIPYCPWINTHDLLEIAPITGRYDFPTLWGVVGGVHEADATAKYTELELHGGGTVGQYYAWHARRGTIPGPRLDFYAIRVQRMDALSTDTHWAVQVESGAGVEEIWDAWLVQSDETDSGEAWDAVRDAVDYREDADPDTPYVALVPKAGEGEVAYYRVEGRYTEPGTSRLVVDELRGAWQRPFYGTPPPLAASLDAIENAEGTEFTALVTVTVDPRGVHTAPNVFIRQPDGVTTGPHACSLVSASIWDFGPSPVAPKGHFTDLWGEVPRNDGGQPLYLPIKSVDGDKLANVRSVTWADANVTVATGVVIFDTDTDEGTDKARMSVDGGAWETFDVAADLTGTTPPVTLTDAVQPVVLQAMDVAGNWGPEFATQVNKAPPPVPPGLADPQPPPSVFDNGSEDEWEIDWSVTGSVNDTDHAIQVTTYNNGVTTMTTPLLDPSDGTVVGDVAGGDGVSDLHKALIKLIRRADGAVIDARFTPEVMSAT